VAVFLDAQPAQQGGCIALGIPAFNFSKLTLQFGSADTILIAKVRLGVERVFLLHDLKQALVSPDDRLQHADFVKLKVVLPQHRHTLVRLYADMAGGRLNFAGEDF